MGETGYVFFSFRCGYATLHDVTKKDHEDRMESFFLSETCKYLILVIMGYSRHGYTGEEGDGKRWGRGLSGIGMLAE